MGSAVIGLVGALLGGAFTLLGAALSERRQARRDDRKWRREQRMSAYDGALRHLLRAANLRSEFAGGRGAAVLKQEHQREWFDDLVEAQFWLHAATRHCDAAQLDRLTGAALLLDSHVALLNTAERFDGKDFSILQILRQCIDTVTDCARLDGGERGTARAVRPEPPGPPPPGLPFSGYSQIPMGNPPPQINLGGAGPVE
ncbi:hypothetical protein [Actinomadura chokoriensis]|uniref:Uncharacterized protein n=1 Tax=Actinomadura chokoriensis TaxID=454156 RepID=A0ABV4R5Z4_9ACTN